MQHTQPTDILKKIYQPKTLDLKSMPTKVIHITFINLDKRLIFIFFYYYYYTLLTEPAVGLRSSVNTWWDITWCQFSFPVPRRPTEQNRSSNLTIQYLLLTASASPILTLAIVLSIFDVLFSQASCTKARKKTSLPTQNSKKKRTRPTYQFTTKLFW